MTTTSESIAWWNTLQKDKQLILCLEYFPGTGIQIKNLTLNDIEGIYREEKVKGNIPNNEELSFCSTCGVCNHTSSECSFASANENLNNSGALR